MTAPRVLVAIGPRMYAEGLASSLATHRPRAEVTILDPPESVEDGALRVRPHLIVAHRVPPEARAGAFWVEVAQLVGGEGAKPLGAQISADGYSTSVAEVRTEHVLAALAPGPRSSCSSAQGQAHPGGTDKVSTRVHLADDRTMFREGLKSILSSREGIEVVGSTSTGEEAVERVRQTKPDVIVTQLDMQPKTAQEIIEGLRGASPGSRIVVLTLWDNARYLRAVAAMGINALIHKSSTAGELAAIVEAASLRPGGGDTVVSLPRAFLQKMTEGPGGLTGRQVEIVVLAARGLSNRQVASELHLAESTIKRPLANIYEEMGVRSRNEAVRRALEEQWIGIHEITSAEEDGHHGSHG